MSVSSYEEYWGQAVFKLIILRQVDQDRSAIRLNWFFQHGLIHNTESSSRVFCCFHSIRDHLKLVGACYTVGCYAEIIFMHFPINTYFVIYSIMSDTLRKKNQFGDVVITLSHVCWSRTVHTSRTRHRKVVGRASCFVALTYTRWSAMRKRTGIWIFC